MSFRLSDFSFLFSAIKVAVLFVTFLNFSYLASTLAMLDFTKKKKLKETKSTKTKRNETKRNQQKRNETKRNQRNENEIKQNQRKQKENNENKKKKITDRHARWVSRL
jgi:lipopolysaccharide export LptBFGC system permease protein LptF